MKKKPRVFSMNRIAKELDDNALSAAQGRRTLGVSLKHLRVRLCDLVSRKALAAGCRAKDRIIGKPLLDEPAASALPLNIFKKPELWQIQLRLFIILIGCAVGSICQAQESPANQAYISSNIVSIIGLTVDYPFWIWRRN